MKDGQSSSISCLVSPPSHLYRNLNLRGFLMTVIGDKTISCIS